MDTGTVKKLIELLDKEAAIYEGLLRLSRDKTDIIVQESH